ncbi:hydantoinase B/oxoprolinase family protein [Euzebya sp.]|uniref:hydantoinase B/oxoprolinase family protein n=1 Tax=Euzebya sp. TaxID=1971409 RepID=UPI003518AA2A
MSDASRLQVVRHALDGIAEQMGVALERSAYSPNVTERLDLSAAVFGPDGRMVAQAEHIPVHLGSMPASVRAVLDRFDLRPGMQARVNHPHAGGSPLPDMPRVGAVGDDDGRLLGYVANRAHHADIAGAAPGSMPADAVDIAMEGLRVPPTLLVDGHGERPDVIDLLAANSRTPAERYGDLRAQFAANHAGAARLRELAAERGADGLLADMAALQDHADRRIRAALRDMPTGSWSATDILEHVDDDHPDGLELAVTVELTGDRLVVDLRRCPAQVAANVNAVRAVTESAALFVLRLLADPGAPANEGTARALEVRTTPGTVVDATFPAPVATGNVETSQRLIDLLLAALAPALPARVPAASQGTMNNVLIGSRGVAAPFSYYETIGGGEGGTPRRPGMHGIHTGMTNTRNTPVEALELAYPLRVLRSELRTGSGGAGHHPGGEGVVREVEVLAPATVTLQTERRARGPWGLAGGSAGAPGRNTLITADGDVRDLPAKATISVQAGDRIRLETPGGGGWGDPPAGR